MIFYRKVYFESIKDDKIKHKASLFDLPVAFVSDSVNAEDPFGMLVLKFRQKLFYHVKHALSIQG